MTNPEHVFAPRPLANHLLSDAAVPVWPYRSGELLDFSGEPVSMAFTAIDLDLWARDLAEAVDWVLSKAVDSPIAAELRCAKGALARRFSELMVPLFADQALDPEALAAARKAYLESMLVALANAYADEGDALPLRRAPAPPAPVSQFQRPHDDLFHWTYAVEYEQHDRAAQDQIQFSASMDAPAPPPAAVPLFHALAEFAFVHPELRKDLEETPCPAAALDSFVNVVGRVAAAWAPVSSSVCSSEGMATIREFEREGRLVIESSGAVPVIHGFSTPHPPTAPPFEYEFVGADGRHLTAVEGRAVARRALVFPPRHIVADRIGTFAARTIRNARLSDTRPTAPEFVYDSGPAAFGAPVHASLDWEQPVDLAQIEAPPRSLTVYLTELFDRVFGAGAVAVSAQLFGIYESSNGATFPLFAALGVAGVPDPAAIEKSVAAWLRESAPDEDGGTLRFDLAVTSTASDPPMPLLRLRNLFVRLADVEGILP